MRVTLPYPPSGNHYKGWRTVKTKSGRVVPTAYVKKEGNAFRVVAQLQCKASGVRVTDRDVKLNIIAYRPRKSGDIDNFLKCLLDALEGVAYRDDKQVVSLTVIRKDDKNNPRVEVEILPIGNEDKEEPFDADDYARPKKVSARAQKRTAVSE